MDNNLMVQIYRIGLVNDTKAIFCSPAVDVYRVMHYCNRYAIQHIDAVAFVVMTDDDTVITRCGDDGCGGFAGRNDEERTADED